MRFNFFRCQRAAVAFCPCCQSVVFEPLTHHAMNCKAWVHCFAYKIAEQKGESMRLDDVILCHDAAGWFLRYGFNVLHIDEETARNLVQLRRGENATLQEITEPNAQKG